MFLHTVSCRPPGHLALGSAAELQELIPELFKDIENTGDTLVLVLFCGAKGQPAHVDMEPTGSGLMGCIAQVPGQLLTSREEEVQYGCAREEDVQGSAQQQ